MSSPSRLSPVEQQVGVSNVSASIGHQLNSTDNGEMKEMKERMLNIEGMMKSLTQILEKNANIKQAAQTSPERIKTVRYNMDTRGSPSIEEHQPIDFGERNEISDDIDEIDQELNINRDIFSNNSYRVLSKLNTTNDMKSNPIGSGKSLPAAIDDKMNLPEMRQPSLKGQTITADVFAQWKEEIINIIDGVPKFSPLISTDPEEAWKKFIRMNSKYYVDELEDYYLRIHKTLWDYITSCYEIEDITPIIEEIKEECGNGKHHLPSLLKFKKAMDADFYKDSSILILKLTDRFYGGTNWRIDEYEKQFNALRYIYGTDPDIFFKRFTTLLHKLNKLCPDYPTYNDTVRAHKVLARLPKELDGIKLQFMNPKNPPKFSDIATTLRNWYQSEKKANNNDNDNQNRPNWKNNNSNKHTYGTNNNNNSPTAGKSQVGAATIFDYVNVDSKSRKNNLKPNNNNKHQGKSVKFDSDAASATIENKHVKDHKIKSENISTVNSIQNRGFSREAKYSRRIYPDSCATSSFITNKSLYNPNTIHNIPPTKVYTMCGNTDVETAGDVQLTKGITLKEVKLMENGIMNIMSIAPFTDENDAVIVFSKKNCYVVEEKDMEKTMDIVNNKCMMKGNRDGNLYYFTIGDTNNPGGKINEISNSTIEEYNIELLGNNEFCAATIISQRKANDNKDVVNVTTRRQQKQFHSNEELRLKEQIIASEMVENIEEKYNENLKEQDDILTMIPVFPIENTTFHNLKMDNDIKLFHSRLGHMGINIMKLTNEAYKLGFNKEQLYSIENDVCTTCIKGKSKHKPIGRKTAKPWRVASQPMEVWHCDLIGPFSYYDEERKKKKRIFSRAKNRYYLDIIDEWARYTMGMPLRYKSDATKAIITLIKFMQNKTNKILGRFHVDGAKEFLSKELIDFLESQGTEITTSVPHTPSLNGLAEKNNDLLITGALCMHLHCDAPQELFEHPILYMNYLMNIIAQPRINGEIPHKRMFPMVNEKINLDKVHVYGCDVHVLIEKTHRGKMQSKTQEGVFLGYSQQYTAYKILLCNDNLDMIVSRDIEFVETSFQHMKNIKERLQTQCKLMQQEEEEKERTGIHMENEFEVEFIDGERIEKGIIHYEVYWKGYDEPTWEPKDNLDNCQGKLDEYFQRKEGDYRIHFDCANTTIDLNGDLEYLNSNFNSTDILMSTQIKMDHIPKYDESKINMNEGNRRNNEFNSYYNLSDLNYPIPMTMDQAMRHHDRHLWFNAVWKEYGSLIDLNVFKEHNGPLPPGMKAVDTKLVFDIKRNQDNQIEKWKARLVARGFSQREGIDYVETYAPTASPKSERMIFTISAMEDYEIVNFDVNTAFLYADIVEELYVLSPPGFPTKCKYLRLLKALYGLKQAAREWNKKYDKVITALGYEATPVDPSTYIKIINKLRHFILTHVDDVISAFPKAHEHIWLEDKRKICESFSIKDLGDCEWVLKVKIIRERNNKILYLSQEAYVERLLAKRGMSECKSTKTPYWTTDLSPQQNKMNVEKLNEEEVTLYRGIVGDLIYTVIRTRVDMAYITGLLARYQNETCNYHMHAAKYALRYLRGTSNLKLRLGNISKKKDYHVDIYCDSDWASDKIDYKSTGGFIAMLNGSPISWQSKKQSTTSLSATEAEIYSVVEAIKEGLFIKQWFQLYMGKDLPVLIHCDNEGAIKMADHPTNHNHTKHINIKNFFIREHIHNGSVKIQHIPTEDQLADIFTKPTPYPILYKHRKKILF